MMKKLWKKLKVIYLLIRINMQLKKIFKRKVRLKDLNPTYKSACNHFDEIVKLLGPAILIFQDPATKKTTYLLSLKLTSEEINTYLRNTHALIYNEHVLDNGKNVWVVKH